LASYDLAYADIMRGNYTVL